MPNEQVPMLMMPTAIANIVGELRELQVTYGYMVHNAPTEEARRMAQLNLMTVENSLTALGAMYLEAAGVAMPPIEAAEAVPIFASFMEATRYAFMEETGVIRMMSDLYVGADVCYRDRVFMLLSAHQLNAMRDLYLLT